MKEVRLTKKIIDLKALLSSAPQQWPIIRPAVRIILAMAFLLTCVVVGLHFVMKVPTWYLTCDIFVLFPDMPFYCAFLAHIGMFFWAAAAAIAFLVGAVLPKGHDLKSYFEFSGWGTLYFGLDDAFLVHDRIMPEILGLPEMLAILGYVILISCYLFKFRRAILRTEYLLMALSLFCFGASLVLDVLNLKCFDPVILEEGAKLIGIIAWLGYFIVTGRTAALGQTTKSADLKTLLSSASQQWKIIRPAVGLVFAAAFLLIGIVISTHIVLKVPIWYLVCDIASSFHETPFYCALLSQIGVFFWAATGAVALMTAAILPKGHDLKAYFVFSGWLTLYLGLDDIFMLHDYVLPEVFGSPEKFTVFVYVSVVLYYLFRFRWAILKTEYLLMALSLSFFGCSLVLDTLEPKWLDPYIWEDSAKLVGLIAWLGYFFAAGLTVIRQQAKA
jgi:hypothetical protein